MSAISNIKATTSISSPPTSIIISYCNKSQLDLLKNWKDLHFFTIVFSCLFLFESNGHLKQWKKLMSLEAWVKFTLQNYFYQYVVIASIHFIS